MAQRSTRPRDASVRSLPLRFVMHAAMHRATSAFHCVLRNVRSKVSTDSLRLPRFRAAYHVCAHTADFSHSDCHANRCPATRWVAPFPTPTTRNARCMYDSPRLPRESTCAPPLMATVPHTCHAKRTLSNVKLHDFPHLPHGSSVQRPAPSQAGTCIQRPMPATQSAHPPCS